MTCAKSHAWSDRIVRETRRFVRDTAGNTLPLVAAAIVPMLALTGGGIDMGRGYLSQSRLQQACDAGVLAARKKLPVGSVGPTVPSASSDAGNRFFNINFRSGSYGTDSRTFTMKLEADSAISGVATVNVPTTIMKIFGYTTLPITVKCEAQLNYANIDVMMVLDTTGSMEEHASPSDTQSKLETLKAVVKNFYNQMEAQRSPTSRVRYGFVPYSTNVNVGAVLDDNWVVSQWAYQSRRNSTSNDVGMAQDWTNFVYVSGDAPTKVISSYAATYHANGATEVKGTSGDYTCDTAPPADTLTSSAVELSRTTTAYAGPPAGTKTTIHYRRTQNGIDYYVELAGTTCNLKEQNYTNYIDEYDYVTWPAFSYAGYYDYMPLTRNVTNWRTETTGCIEERKTYEINNYNSVNFNRALDLNLDLVPTADPDTRWRPQYPNDIYERSLSSYYDSNSNFSIGPVTTYLDYFKPTAVPGLVACPAPAKKLSVMSAAELNTYIDSLTALGATYHDIGMIWGGRLISPTGLFAAENADVGGIPTSRNLIFLTDGETAPMDVVYGAYGVEPLDRRRWSLNSTETLTDVVEKRFIVACNEVKRRNVTVWVISFGLNVTQLMKDCAGPGHYYQANDAIQLNNAFISIGRSIGDLRISK